MTASPLLPRGMTGSMAETEATDAELSRMTELALSRGARAIATGRGNSPAATRAVGEFARRFQATGGIIICAVTWPESARPGYARPHGSPPRIQTCGSWQGQRPDGPR